MGVESKTRTLKLKNVNVDPAIQPRAAGLDEGHVADLEAAYRAGAAVPPPRVVKTASGAMWLSRGFHRIAAALRAGLAELEFEVVAGDRKDAIIDAACSNTDHGLKRTNADKRRAVEILLTECPEWSDRKLADSAGVGDDLVRAVRKATVQVPFSGTCDAPAKRVGKDGKAYTVKPKSPLKAPEPEAEDPAIVAEAGLSADPVEVVAPADDDANPEDTPIFEPEPPATPPPAEADPAADSLAAVETLCRDMDAVAGRMKGLKADRYCYAIHVDSAVAQVEAARKTLWQGRAAFPCPYCEASGEPGCRACGGTRRVKRSTRDSGLEAMGGRK